MHYNSQYFNGRRFHNLEGDRGNDKGFMDLIKWRFSRTRKSWPDFLPEIASPTLLQNLENSEVNVTFINHATELIQLANLNILTDPVFSEHLTPFRWLGPKRVRPMGLAWDQMPVIQVVLISHNHYDHLDLPSLIEIAKRDKPLFIVPLGNAKLLKANDIENVIELDWWQSHAVNNNQTITLVPARHWSSRFLFDHCRTLWGGYVIQSHSLKLYFAGDTGLGSHFEMIYNRFGNMDISFLPIGSYAPRWFMQANHINPEEAVRAHQILHSILSIAMHFGTFQLSDEGIDEPIVDLQAAMKKFDIPTGSFVIPENGKTVYYKA